MDDVQNVGWVASDDLVDPMPDVVSVEVRPFGEDGRNDQPIVVTIENVDGEDAEAWLSLESARQLMMLLDMALRDVGEAWK